MTIQLKLFVMGSVPRSAAAIETVKRAIAEHANNGIDLEIIDVADAPQEAEEHRILATPTVVRVAPPPVRRVIGDVSDPAALVTALALPTPGGGEREGGE